MSDKPVYRAGVEWFGDTRQLDKSISEVNKKLGGFGKGMKRFGGLLGFGFSAYTVKKIADMGKQMSNLAAQTGLSVTSLSAMSSAFRSIGSSAGTASRVISKMNQAAVGLNLGHPEAAARLASMGIFTMDRTGKLKSGKALKMEVANWARQKRSEGIDRRMILAVLQEMGFDAASAQMAMNGGAGAFYRQEAEMRRYGAYTTDYEAKNLKQLSTDLDVIGAQLSSFSGAVLAPLADFTKPLVDDFKSGMGDLIKGIREKTQEITGKKDAWNAAKQGLRDDVRSIWEGVKTFGATLGFDTGAKFDVWKLAGQGIAAFQTADYQARGQRFAGFNWNPEGNYWQSLDGAIKAQTLNEAMKLQSLREPIAKGLDAVSIKTDEPLPVQGEITVNLVSESGETTTYMAEINQSGGSN